MISSMFTREAAEKIRPHIQATADQLIDEMIKGGCEKPVDLVEKFALPLPSYVSSRGLRRGKSRENLPRSLILNYK